MYFNDIYQQIMNQKTPADLSAFKIDSPGIIDTALMREYGQNPADLEKLRTARMEQLYAQEAAPTAAEASRLNRMAANDPYVGSAEGLADFAERPGFWLGADSAGTIPGGKGKAPATSEGANPYTAQVVENFGNQNQNILDAFRAGQQDPMALARLTQNKDLAGNFQNTQQAANYLRDDARQGAAEAGKEAARLAEENNLRNFASSVAMLTTPSERTGQMMPFGEASSLVQQAAADYPVKPELINNATDNLLAQYKETRFPVSGTIGRTSFTGTRNLMGDINKDVTSVAPVTNNRISMYAAPTSDAITAWADRIAAGQTSIAEVPRQSKDAVMAMLGTKYPDIDLSKLKANQKYQQAAGNLQSRALINGVEPLFDNLLAQGKKLNNGPIKTLNRLKNTAKEHTGDPEIVAFNNLRDDVIAESERILMGSGVLSDTKYIRAVNNISSAASYPQLQAAVKQLRMTVKTRLHALDQQAFKTTGPTAGAGGKGSSLQDAAAAEMKRRGL